MSNPFKTPEFKTLFQEWNERLKADGLPEVEDFSQPTPALKVWHSFRFQHSLDPYGQARKHDERYYELANQVLLTFLFKKERHRQIWEFHCQGLSVRQIASRIDRNKSTVNHVVRMIEWESGMRYG